MDHGSLKMKNKKLTEKQIRELEYKEYQMLMKHPAVNMLFAYSDTKEYNILEILSKLLDEQFDMGYNTAIDEMRQSLHRLGDDE